MLYEYECIDCTRKFDVIKHHSEYLSPENCPECGKLALKRVSLFNGPKMERAEYNPAFGQIVKSKRHRDQLAKERGLVEVGTESMENINKAADKQMKEKTSWANVL